MIGELLGTSNRRLQFVKRSKRYIALSNTPLTSAYMYNSDRVERFV